MGHRPYQIIRCVSKKSRQIETRNRPRHLQSYCMLEAAMQISGGKVRSLVLGKSVPRETAAEQKVRNKSPKDLDGPERVLGGIDPT